MQRLPSAGPERVPGPFVHKHSLVSVQRRGYFVETKARGFRQAQFTCGQMSIAEARATPVAAKSVQKRGYFIDRYLDGR